MHDLKSCDSSTYFLEMVNDIENHSITEVVTKWDTLFKQRYSFAINLSEQMFKEYKYSSIKEIYKLSKFKHKIQEIQYEARKYEKMNKGILNKTI